MKTWVSDVVSKVVEIKEGVYEAQIVFRKTTYNRGSNHRTETMMVLRNNDPESGNANALYVGAFPPNWEEFMMVMDRVRHALKVNGDIQD